MYKQALLAYVMAERVQRVAVGKSPFALKAVSSELVTGMLTVGSAAAWLLAHRFRCGL